MVDIQDSEREQIETLKKWWNDNGRVATVGLVLGLGGVFGWSWWQTYTTSQAEQASAIYEELVNWAAAENFSQVNTLAETLMREYPNSGYAPLSGLIRASSAFTQNQPDEAKGYLKWVLENAKREDLKTLARLRLAQLLFDEGDRAGALGMLDQGDPGTLVTPYTELRGDILSADGDTKAAADAYRTAIGAESTSPVSQRRLEMKLADLGVDG